MNEVKVKKSKVVYQNQWISVREDEYSLNGKDGLYSVIDRPSCLVALPLTPSGKTVLVKHFRYATQEVSWEFPMGSKDNNESDEEGTKRELHEEVGLEPQFMEHIGSLFPAPGLLSQKAEVFVAHVSDESLLSVHLADETEDIQEIKVFSFDDIPKLISDHTITDGITIAAFLFYSLHVQKELPH